MDDEEEIEAAKRRHPSQQEVVHPAILSKDQFRPHLRLIKGGLEEVEE